MEYYHEREEDNLDYDPDLHHCGSNPGGSLSYVNSVTGEFCRGPDTDDEEDFDREMSYEMYAEDCSGQQNLDSEEEEVEDDSFSLNGLCMASQRSNEQPVSVGTKEAESENDKEADSDKESDSYNDESVGIGSTCDNQYLEEMRRMSEDEDDNWEANCLYSQCKLSEELDKQILSFMINEGFNLDAKDTDSDGYICHICGEKPKNMRIHYNSRHKGPCACGFCGKVMEFCSIAAHIQLEHRAETGLFVPPPKPPGAEPLKDLDLEKELDRMRGSRNWRIIKKSGYCCMYDEKQHTPIAVIQRLTKASLVKKVGQKAEADTEFYAAKELKTNIHHKSFKNEGNVVGHLAARADCVSSESAYKDSHSMLNATPQNPRVNGGVILVSEKLGRLLVYYWDDIIIITGPIFDEEAETVESINGVEYQIPTAFFKILILRREGEPSRIMTFIISNKFENSNLFNRKATLKQISERTGLDLSAYQHLQYTWDLQVPMFKCPRFRCHNTFTTEAELTEHLHDHPWKCHKCCKVFPSDSEKDEHLATHRVHICQYCEAGFYSKDTLISHERTHTGERPYVCTDPACNGKSFKQKSQLTRHKKIKHSDEEKPYHCEVVGCGKKFALKQNLESHIRTHTGEKPFVCSDCGLRFAQSSNLNGHIREVHKKERPHQCEYCKKSFARKSYLKQHINSVHLNQPVSDSEEEHEEDPSDTGLGTSDAELGPSDSVTSSSGNAVTGKRKIEETSDEQPVPAKQMRLNSEGNGVSIAESVSSTSKLDGKAGAGKAGTARASKNVILPFGCRKKKCGRRFLTKESLIDHMHNFVANDYPYRCMERGCELVACEKKSALDRHIRNVHLKKTSSSVATESAPQKKACGKPDSAVQKSGLAPIFTATKAAAGSQRNVRVSSTDAEIITLD